MSNSNDLNQEIQNLIDEAFNDSALMTDINTMLAETYDPYVPYVTGALASNITIDKDGITYNQPYAEEVYESNQIHSKEKHPLASSHWDEVAFANHQDEIEKYIEEKLDKWTKTKQ